MKKLFIKNNITISESMQLLIECGTKCLLVINDKQQLEGTLSDSDIRRAILKQKKLSSSIKTVYNKKPKFLYQKNYKEEDARKIFLKYVIDLIPILNEKREVISVKRINDIFRPGDIKKKNILKIPVVIMAGGKGSRLEPFTSILPKPLIPVRGKSIIEHIFKKFINYGVQDFYVSINYKSKILTAFFEEAFPDYSIKLLKEDKPLGTAGSLMYLKKFDLGDFFLTNCDVIIDHDFNNIYDFHKRNKNSITIVAAIKKYVIPYGDCKIDKKGNFEYMHEKPMIELLANTGIYILNGKVLKTLKTKKQVNMNDFIEKCKKRNMKIGIYPIDEKEWIDVGQWSDYKEALGHFSFHEQ